MSSILRIHTRIFQFTQQRQKCIPPFQILLNTHKSITLLINTSQINQTLSQFLYLIFHLSRINISPLILQIQNKSCLTILNMTPQFLQTLNIRIYLLQIFITPIQLLREIKHLYLLIKCLNFSNHK
jgi:hypothetical protein